MKVVGTRKTRIVGGVASGDALRAGARFNDEIHRLPTGSTTHLPRGVYRFRTHEDANRFDLDCRLIRSLNSRSAGFVENQNDQQSEGCVRQTRPSACN